MAIIHAVWKGGSGLGRGANWFSFWWESAAGVVDDAEGLIGFVNNRLSDDVLDIINSNYSVGRTDWTFYDDVSSPAYPTQVFTYTALAGTEISSPLDSRQTMLIEFKAFENDGPVRKRVYLGCYGEANNSTSGGPEGDTVAAVQTFADHMLVPLTVNGHSWIPVVGRIDPITHEVSRTNVLISHLVQSKWAWLRSRGAGRGI